eukprot:5738532-Amphidinium_carterae.1
MRDDDPSGTHAEGESRQVLSDRIPPLAHMPREESPARLIAEDRKLIPLAHMPRERQCKHPQ